METEKLGAFAPFLLIDGVLVFVMVMLLHLDWIVNNVLYDYSLVFSGDWAVPYWTALRISLALLVFAIGAVSVIGYGSYRRVRRESEKVIFVCKSCGNAWTELDRIVKTKDKLPKFKVLKTCPSCSKKPSEEDAQILQDYGMRTQVETSVSSAKK
jgi:hypothetical protein